MSGAAVGQIVMLMAIPLLSRIYSPSDFGLFAILIAVAGIAAPFSTLKYETAILINEKSHPPESLLILSLVILGLFTLFFFVVSIYLTSLFPDVGYNDKHELVVVLAACVLANGVNTVLVIWHSRHKRFSAISVGKLLQAIGMVVGQMVLGMFAGSLGLIYGYLIGITLSCTLYAYIVFSQDRSSLKTNSAARMIWIAAVKHKRFPLISTWSSLLNALVNQLPSLLFAKLFSVSVTGHYSMANRILRAPLGLIGQSIYQVLAQHIGSNVDNKHEVVNALNVLVSKMMLFSIVPFIVLTIYLDQFIGIVLGGQWNESGRYAQIMAPWIFTIFMSWPLTSIFNTFGHQGMLLVFNMIFVGVIVVGFSTISVGFGSTGVLIVMSVLGSVSRILYCAWILRTLDSGMAFRLVGWTIACTVVVAVAAFYG